MLTTPEEPAHCLSQLKNRNARSPSVMTGHYRLKDDRVTIILHRQEVRNNNPVYKRNRKRDNMHENAEQTFHLVRVFGVLEIAFIQVAHLSFQTKFSALLNLIAFILCFFINAKLDEKPVENRHNSSIEKYCFLS